MRVLVDFHHQALLHSLYLLFEKRLGWEMYRPIGPEWSSSGFWSVYNHPNTVEQFLGLHQGTSVPCDVHGEPLPEIERKNLHYTVEDGIYYIKDLTFETTHRAVRLGKFKEMEFDVLVSSVPQHIQPFNKLIAQFQPKAKHIFQVGNNWANQRGVANIMASTAPFATNAHVVFYHQEFDLDIFRYEPPTFHNVINSYIHYMKAPHQFAGLLSKLPGWTGAMYGAGMGQQLHGVRAVADAMRQSSFTWHYKPGGDGFGHVIYGSYACGRPALIYKNHYRGCGADALLEDQVTCIDTSLHTGEGLVGIVQNWARPENHRIMCQNAYDRFKQIVDFDAEFEQIKKFLEDLR